MRPVGCSSSVWLHGFFDTFAWVPHCFIVRRFQFYMDAFCQVLLYPLVHNINHNALGFSLSAYRIVTFNLETSSATSSCRLLVSRTTERSRAFTDSSSSPCGHGGQFQGPIALPLPLPSLRFRIVWRTILLDQFNVLSLDEYDILLVCMKWRLLWSIADTIDMVLWCIDVVHRFGAMMHRCGA